MIIFCFVYAYLVTNHVVYAEYKNQLHALESKVLCRHVSLVVL